MKNPQSFFFAKEAKATETLAYVAFGPRQDFKESVLPNNVAARFDIPWADGTRESVKASDLRRVVSEAARTYPTADIEDVTRTLERHGITILDQ